MAAIVQSLRDQGVRSELALKAAAFLGALLIFGAVAVGVVWPFAIAELAVLVGLRSLLMRRRQ